MRQINNILDVQQVTKDLQDQVKNIAIASNKASISSINPKQFFIASETGANNAIQGGVPVTLQIGVVVLVLLAHTLQIGANTFNGAPIKSHRNNTNNIAAGYSTGSIIQLVWDGTNWQDLSQ